ARTEQNVACVPVVRNAGITDGADKDRVVLAELVVPAGWNGDARLKEIVGAPRKRLERQRTAKGFSGGEQDASRGRGPLRADPVPWNDRDAHSDLVHVDLGSLQMAAEIDVNRFPLGEDVKRCGARLPVAVSCRLR